MPYPLHPTVILPIRKNIQDELYDCGPASLKIVMETLGRKVSEAYLMKVTRTRYDLGTEQTDMIRVLRLLRIKHEVKEHASLSDIEEAILRLNLCLVNFQSWGKGGADAKRIRAGHYSVIFGFDKNKFYLADPSKLRTTHGLGRGMRTINKLLFAKRFVGWSYACNRPVNGWLVTIPILQKIKNPL